MQQQNNICNNCYGGGEQSAQHPIVKTRKVKEALGHEDSLDVVANVTENINDVNEDKMNVLPLISES